MILLHIDTSNNQKVVANLEIDGKLLESISESEIRKPESVLILIENVCRKAHVDLEQIDEIRVVEGPGSYTGLKVGVSVANALSFGLGKKVNKKRIGKLIEPKYE